ncbi:HAD family hydrolase [Fusibacter sp. 3D3]|uniref:HAD family hydrolase n=1 Tax=Fusibacter sp. 3D3 TaxID=1048380 RepID=UPI0008566852|nr:HAD family hydrolase [Fusibacter sp. 3D3]GAU76185.1 HDIG domain protein [Fusibacter sp. 3D3]
MSIMERKEAFELLKTEVKSESLIKHCLAVEASMRWYSAYFDEPLELWGQCGLLHDIDFEKYPEEHPLMALDLLRSHGYDEAFVTAVKGHGDHTNTPRETSMAKTLFAVDELSSFVVAVALVRPDKFVGLASKSVKKKLKDKAFARAVSREDIAKGSEELGVDLTEHIDHVIQALSEREAELNKEGLSLL